MGVVTTETIHFDAAPFKKVIRCNRDGLFRIKYPEALVRLLGDPKEAVAETMDAAEKEFGQRLWEYKQAGTTTRKVIIYRIKLRCSIRHPATDDQPERTLFRDDISFGNGLGVTVWANVFEETRVQLGDDKARYNYGRVESTLPASIRHASSMMGIGRQGEQDGCAIEWTAEREAFFGRISEAMEALCLKLDDMTAEGAEKLAEIADTWSGSLLTDGKD
jgi:hypothetical protein